MELKLGNIWHCTYVVFYEIDCSLFQIRFYPFSEEVIVLNNKHGRLI